MKDAKELTEYLAGWIQVSFQEMDKETATEELKEANKLLSEMGAWFDLSMTDVLPGPTDLPEKMRGDEMFMMRLEMALKIWEGPGQYPIPLVTNEEEMEPEQQTLTDVLIHFLPVEW